MTAPRNGSAQRKTRRGGRGSAALRIDGGIVPRGTLTAKRGRGTTLTMEERERRFLRALGALILKLQEQADASAHERPTGGVG